ncbi:hypothetical protein [Labrys neptuniae]
MDWNSTSLVPVCNRTVPSGRDGLAVFAGRDFGEACDRQVLKDAAVDFAQIRGIEPTADR